MIRLQSNALPPSLREPPANRNDRARPKGFTDRQWLRGWRALRSGASPHAVGLLLDIPESRIREAQRNLGYTTIPATGRRGRRMAILASLMDDEVGDGGLNGIQGILLGSMIGGCMWAGIIWAVL